MRSLNNGRQSQGFDFRQLDVARLASDTSKLNEMISTEGKHTTPRGTNSTSNGFAARGLMKKEANPKVTNESESRLGLPVKKGPSKPPLRPHRKVDLQKQTNSSPSKLRATD